MRRLIVGLAGLAMALGVAAGAAAQTPAAPIPAAPGAASVETTTIGDLLDNPASKAVIAKDMPDLIAYPGLDQIKGMTLRAISAYPEAKLDDAKLTAIQKDLDAAKK
jgi:para-nitrobenzyl esterase